MAGFLKAIPEPASGFFVLFYIISFILIYFTVAFYILSSSLKSALILIANNLIKGDQKHDLKLKTLGEKILSIYWISKVGVCVKDENSLVLIPWKSYKTIEIIYALGKQNTKRK